MLAALLGSRSWRASAPAFAHVVEVTTAYRWPTVEDQETLTAASCCGQRGHGECGRLQAHADRAHTGQRHRRTALRAALMADAEGEEMLRDFAPDGPPSGTDDGAPAEHTYSKEPI